MAASIIFMNIDQLESRQYKKFILTIIIAYMFHHSATILFALLLGMHYLVASDLFGKRLWLKNAIFYSGVLVMCFTKRILGSFYDTLAANGVRYSGYVHAYIEGEESTGTAKTVVLVALGEILMTFLYRKKGACVLAGKSDCENNLDFYRYNIIFLLVYRQAVGLMTGRVLIYTMFANMLLIAALPRFVKEKHLRFMVAVTIMAYYVLHWFYDVVYLRDANNLWPYKSIL